jgi:pimeloyl-ACP methyl ester carboxylesterase
MGPPGSRLDLCFGEDIAAEHGVRLVSFDRPGYGGSTAAPFGLAAIGADAHAVADGLGVDRFATLGQSGGGPGALAAAAIPGSRVIRAGVASGAGPFRLVPGVPGDLDENDAAAVALLPGAAVVRQRGPVRPARARAMAVAERAERTARDARG